MIRELRFASNMAELSVTFDNWQKKFANLQNHLASAGGMGYYSEKRTNVRFLKPEGVST